MYMNKPYTGWAELVLYLIMSRTRSGLDRFWSEQTRSVWRPELVRQTGARYDITIGHVPDVTMKRLETYSAGLSTIIKVNDLIQRAKPEGLRALL